MSPVFFDTNILVYKFDSENSEKSDVANRLIQKHYVDKTGFISTQIVQEFINVSLRKFKPRYSTKQVALIINELLDPMCKHYPTTAFYTKTVELYEKYSLSFYDSLIVQAALDTNCQTLYSEDLQDGQTFGKLTVKNPFKG